MAQERLIRQEQLLAERSFSSAAGFEIVSFYIDLPKEPVGKIIVDIGSGASTAILKLQKLGAYTIGVDYRYQNIRWVESSAERSFKGTDPITKRNRQIEEQALQANIKDVPPGANPVLWGLAAQMAKGMLDRSHEQYYQRARQTLQTFLAAKAGGDLRLVAGIAGELPIKSDSVDFAYSVQGVTTFLMKDREVFMQAICEAIRVLKPGEGLKPGGQLQLHPWLSNVVEFSNIERESAASLIEYLDKEHIPHFVEPISPFSSPRLRIIKP